MNKPIKTFSKGMQMKTSLALALSHDAEFIMMDEPTAGLDPVFRRELLDILKELMEDQRRTLFFSTHITSDLEQIADEITFIQQGNILFSESIEDMQARYGIVKGNISLLEPAIEEKFINVRHSGTEFQALTNHKEEVRKSFGNQVEIEDATLEDIMYYAKGAQLQHV